MRYLAEDGHLYYGSRRLCRADQVATSYNEDLLKLHDERFVGLSLFTGDYIFVTPGGKVVGVESKRLRDFISSWRARRLARQLRYLLAAVDIPVLALRGWFEETFVQPVAWADVREAMLDLAKWQALGGSVVAGPADARLFADFLFDLRAGLVEKRSLLSPIAGTDDRKPPRYLDTTARALYRAVDGVGPVLATRLSERFGTFLAVLQADEEELRQVDGVGIRVLRGLRKLKEGK